MTQEEICCVGEGTWHAWWSLHSFDSMDWVCDHDWNIKRFLFCYISYNTHWSTMLARESQYSFIIRKAESNALDAIALQGGGWRRGELAKQQTLFSWRCWNHVRRVSPRMSKIIFPCVKYKSENTQINRSKNSISARKT